MLQYLLNTVVPYETKYASALLHQESLSILASHTYSRTGGPCSCNSVTGQALLGTPSRPGTLEVHLLAIVMFTEFVRWLRFFFSLIDPDHRLDIFDARIVSDQRPNRCHRFPDVLVHILNVVKSSLVAVVIVAVAVHNAVGQRFGSAVFRVSTKAKHRHSVIDEILVLFILWICVDSRKDFGLACTVVDLPLTKVGPDAHVVLGVTVILLDCVLEMALESLMFGR